MFIKVCKIVEKIFKGVYILVKNLRMAGISQGFFCSICRDIKEILYWETSFNIFKLAFILRSFIILVSFLWKHLLNVGIMYTTILTLVTFSSRLDSWLKCTSVERDFYSVFNNFVLIQSFSCLVRKFSLAVLVQKFWNPGRFCSTQCQLDLSKYTHNDNIM